jgi:hypothetical protein
VTNTYTGILETIWSGQMGKKLNKVYEALVNGAADGLTGEALYSCVTEHCPKTSSKRIVKASLFALSDPAVKDRRVLEAIYDLAITYRLSSLGVEEDEHEADDDESRAPSVSQGLKTRLESTVSPIPTLSHEDPVLALGKRVQEIRT